MLPTIWLQRYYTLLIFQRYRISFLSIFETKIKQNWPKRPLFLIWDKETMIKVSIFQKNTNNECVFSQPLKIE